MKNSEREWSNFLTLLIPSLRVWVSKKLSVHAQHVNWNVSDFDMMSKYTITVKGLKRIIKGGLCMGNMTLSESSHGEDSFEITNSYIDLASTWCCWAKIWSEWWKIWFKRAQFRCSQAFSAFERCGRSFTAKSWDVNKTVCRYSIVKPQRWVKHEWSSLWLYDLYNEEHIAQR